MALALVLRRLAGAGLLVVALALAAAGAPPGGEVRHDARLVGHHDLQGRAAYQPWIHRYPDGRSLAFVGHHAGRALNPLTGTVESNGTSIVDVTDPTRPTLVHHLPATFDDQAQMVQTCDGGALPRGRAGRVYLLRANGNREHRVGDVTEPTRPALVSTPVGAVTHPGVRATHKS